MVVIISLVSHRGDMAAVQFSMGVAGIFAAVDYTTKPFCKLDDVLAFPFMWSKTGVPCVAAVPAGCDASNLCTFAPDALSLAEIAPTEMWSCI